MTNPVSRKILRRNYKRGVCLIELLIHDTGCKESRAYVEISRIKARWLKVRNGSYLNFDSEQRAISVTVEPIDYDSRTSPQQDSPKEHAAI